MIKAIIFDLGGVVINWKPLLSKTLAILKPSDRNQFWLELNRELLPWAAGKMTARQVWKKMARKYKKEESVNDLLKAWINDYEKLVSVDQEMISLVASLKGYKLAVITNTTNEHAPILRRLGILEGFDVVILSNEVKMTKDEKEIFLLTVEKLDVEPKECLFIDDVEKFVNVAKSLGMKAILYKNPVQLKEKLESFSVRID